MISGTDFKKVRAELCMTQPEFARWLSEKTGEYFASITICRMENYGQRDACHPIIPSLAVVAAISSLSPSFSQKEIFRSDILDRKPKNKDVTYVKLNPNEYNATSEGDSPMADSQNMTDSQKQMFREVVKLYEDLGILDAPGETATEMIDAVELSISSMENELVGDNINEITDTCRQLEELETEQAEITADLRQVDADLAKKLKMIDPMLLKKLAPEIFDEMNTVGA